MEITNTIKAHRVIARNTIHHKEGNLEVVMNLIYDHLAQFFSDLICKYKIEIDIKVYMINYMNWLSEILRVSIIHRLLMLFNCNRSSFNVQKMVYLYGVRIDKPTLS